MSFRQWQAPVTEGVQSGPAPESLSAAVGGPTTPFVTKDRLSTLCRFFADDDRIDVVAQPDIKARDAGLALAWGLAYRGDRSLSVVLPAGMAEPTRIRAPWLEPPLRVFEYVGQNVTQSMPLSREESLAAFVGRTWGAPRPAALGPKADWVQPVLQWAATAPEVERIERSSYVSWHVGGRQVLKIVTTSKALQIVAGVDSTVPGNWPPVVKFVLTDLADAASVHAIVAAAAGAAAARLTGADTANREHRMQAVLDPERLGLEPGWIREFPAWRPGSSTASYIDFLAKDPHGRVHVVETKIGGDTMLVLQGLDYWLWSKANDAHVHQSLVASSTADPIVHFVVAPSKPGAEAISPYTAAQAESLSGKTPWQFSVVNDPDQPNQYTTLPMRVVPTPRRRAGSTSPRWAVRLQRHMEPPGADTGAAPSSYFASAETALRPQAIGAYESIKERGLLHGFVLHRRSSQAFALNMLAPLSPDAWTSIARHFLDDPDAFVETPPEFEYSDPRDDLAEATAASPHATQVDCVIRARTGAGRTHAFLIEVKLSEDAFSGCSAALSARNSRREVCSQPGPFGGDPSQCFQLANHDREHRRRYDIALGAPFVEPSAFGCWFRDGANQVMRNLALANALIARREVDGATVVLLAPDGHTSIWEQWRRHVEYLSAYPAVRTAELPASQVAVLHDDATARDLGSRYLLPLDLIKMRLAQRTVDDRFPNGNALVRLENDRSIRYVQVLRRMAVVATDPDTISVRTPYPAGPFEHRIPRSTWTGRQGGITVPDPEGDGSRVFTDDLTRFEPLESAGASDARKQLRDEAPALARRLRHEQPWWTAPAQDDAWS